MRLYSGDVFEKMKNEKECNNIDIIKIFFYIYVFSLIIIWASFPFVKMDYMNCLNEFCINGEPYKLSKFEGLDYCEKDTCKCCLRYNYYNFDKNGKINIIDVCAVSLLSPLLITTIFLIFCVPFVEFIINIININFI